MLGIYKALKLLFACNAAIWMGKQRQSGWESGVAALA